MEELKLILTAAIGTAGFSLLFQIKPMHIPSATFGGALTCAIWLLLDRLGAALFLSNLIAALASVIYANILARILKTPASVFITACMIPLVPGGMLFNTMNCLILQDLTGFLLYGKNTLVTALGIAGGIAVESSATNVLGKVFHRNKKKT